MTINAYPLQWPEAWPRTHQHYRVEARFGRSRQGSGRTYVAPRKLSLNEGLERVLGELQRMDVDRQDVVVSTNVPTRLDGLPRSGLAEPADTGAAVYWEQRSGERRVMAIDIYDRVPDNLAAIAATLEALRSIERHGGAMILERAFTGFTALPAPGQGAKRDWWVVLQVERTCTREEAKQAYRKLAALYHPDRPGGSHDAMAELNAAQEQALQERFT